MNVGVILPRVGLYYCVLPRRRYIPTERLCRTTAVCSPACKHLPTPVYDLLPSLPPPPPPSRYLSATLHLGKIRVWLCSCASRTERKTYTVRFLRNNWWKHTTRVTSMTGRCWSRRPGCGANSGQWVSEAAKLVSFWRLYIIDKAHVENARQKSIAWRRDAWRPTAMIWIWLVRAAERPTYCTHTQLAKLSIGHSPGQTHS